MEPAKLNGVVGYILSAAAFEQLQAERAELLELRTKLDEMRRELDELRTERDRFKHAVYDLVREYMPLEEWDRTPLDTTGSAPFELLIVEAERRIQGGQP